MDYPIDTDVPMPAEARLRGRREKYSWSKLIEVGYSFFVPGGNVRQIRSAAVKATKRLGWKFIADIEGDGVRVFRCE